MHLLNEIGKTVFLIWLQLSLFDLRQLLLGDKCCEICHHVPKNCLLFNLKTFHVSNRNDAEFQVLLCVQNYKKLQTGTFPRHYCGEKPHHLHWQPNLLPLKQAYKKGCFQSGWHFSSAVHPVCDPTMSTFCNLAALMLLLTFQSPGESLPQSVNVNCVNVLLCMFNLCYMCFFYIYISRFL